MNHRKYFEVILLIGLLMFSPKILMADLFQGNYATYNWYELNTQNGLNDLTNGPMSMNVTENIAGDRVQVVYEDETTAGPVSLPEFHGQTPNVVATPLRNFDYGIGGITVDMLIASDGNHMAMAMVSQEIDNPLDISLSTAAWLRNTTPSGNITSLIGQWDVNILSDPNLRDTTNGFTADLININITQASSDTILVPFESDFVTLQVGGYRAWLTGGPVSAGGGILHAMDIAFDETGFSFTFIMTESYDESDVSITMGYGSASQVPIPGAIWLLGSGLIGLAGFKRKLRKA